MNTWCEWLLIINLLTAAADRTEHDSKHYPEEETVYEVLIIPTAKIKENNFLNNNVEEQNLQNSLPANDVDNQPILQTKISPLALRGLLHIPPPPVHLSPKLELLKQRIKLKILLAKAKLLHHKTTPGILKSTQKESINTPEDSSEELLLNILESGKEGTGNNILKNTVLTKTTTYNITNLKNLTNDQEFIVTKKEDMIFNMTFLDEKGRPMNFTNAHSSSLQTFIDGDTGEHALFEPFLANITFNNTEDNGKDSLTRNDDKLSKENINSPLKNEDDVKEAQNNVVGGSLTENVSAIDSESISLPPGENLNISTELSTLRPRLNCESGDLDMVECHSVVPTDFVGGQYTTYKNRFDPTLGVDNPIDFQGGVSEMVSGQLIPSIDKNNVVKSTGDKINDKSETNTNNVNDQGDLITTEQSRLGVSNEHKTQFENIDSIEDETTVRSTSTSRIITIDAEGNLNKKMSSSRSDIIASIEEPDNKDRSEENQYYPISMLGMQNSQAHKQDDSNKTNNTLDDKEMITLNVPTEKYLYHKFIDEEPNPIKNENNKHRAKSGEPHLSESAQEEEDISSMRESQEGSILGESETINSSHGEDEKVTTNAIDISFGTVRKGSINSEQNDEITSEISRGDDTILIKGHDSDDSVTATSSEHAHQDSTKPANVSVGEDSESSEVDIVGEPSNVDPSQINSTLVEGDVSKGKGLRTHPVELSAGLQLGEEDYSGTDGPYTDNGSGNDDDSREYLTELCFPLKNKNLSLFDLLSGHLYIEKNGNKIPISLKDNPMKNCTSATKKCKLFLDFKKDLNDLEKETETSLSEDDSNDVLSLKKRHTRAMHSLNLKNNMPVNIELEFNEMFNQPVDNLTLEANKTNTNSKNQEFIMTACNHNLNSENHSSISEADKNINNYHSTGSTKNHSENLLIPAYNSNFYKHLMNLSGSESRSSDETIMHPNNMEASGNVENQKRLPRTIFIKEESSDGGRCTCGSSILQSPSPNLGYQHFVQKRLAILTNIVQAVNDWGSDSKQVS